MVVRGIQNLAFDSLWGKCYLRVGKGQNSNFFMAESSGDGT